MGNVKDLEKQIEEELKIKTEQETQLDWRRIGTRSSAQSNRKQNLGMEKCWENKEIKG